MSAAAGKSSEPKSYAEAMEELERIVRELDSNNVDVDVLSARVQRAMELIAWCDERITAAEVAITEIAATFDADGEDEDDADDD